MHQAVFDEERNGKKLAHRSMRVGASHIPGKISLLFVDEEEAVPFLRQVTNGAF
jgi:hypothetical protein